MYKLVVLARSVWMEKFVCIIVHFEGLYKNQFTHLQVLSTTVISVSSI